MRGGGKNLEMAVAVGKGGAGVEDATVVEGDEVALLGPPPEMEVGLLVDDPHQLPVGRVVLLDLLALNVQRPCHA
jgi:hypothetical protein